MSLTRREEKKARAGKVQHQLKHVEKRGKIVQQSLP
jgi:hypothetical protein